MKPAPAARRKKAPAQPPAPALERVRLAREHTHLGARHPAGDVIAVHPDTAAWLRARGVVSQP